jgi:Protein of unknown function (DUF4231)
MSTAPSPASGRRAPTKSVEEQLLPLVDQLDLEPLQREFLRRRWLDQVSWLENRAAGSQRWYNRLRLITIVGGVIIPALVGLNVSGEVSERIRWTVFGLGLIVALAAAIEGFFHFSDRWPHYRRTAELTQERGLAVLPAQRPVRWRWESRWRLSAVRRPGRGPHPARCRRLLHRRGR